MILFSTIYVSTASSEDGISHNINIYYGIQNWKGSSVANTSEKHQTTKISVPTAQIPTTSKIEKSYATSTSDHPTTMGYSSPTILSSTKEHEGYISKTTLTSPSPIVPLSTTQYIGSGNLRLSSQYWLLFQLFNL